MSRYILILVFFTSYSTIAFSKFDGRHERPERQKNVAEGNCEGIPEKCQAASTSKSKILSQPSKGIERIPERNRTR